VIGISFEQLILLLVLALILFGPERLPEIAEKLGKWVAHLRQASADFTQQYQQVLNPPPPPPLPLPEEFYCVHCARKMEQRFTFCPHCGQRQEEDRPLADHLQLCPSCGRKMESDSLFCPFCGHHPGEKGDHYSRPEPPPRLMSCPQCARQLETDFLFCPGCGQPFEKSPQPPKPLAH
jgi:RNA polymerase subunit RPABC4/transcription elongation factor Spt4